MEKGKGKDVTDRLTEVYEELRAIGADQVGIILYQDNTSLNMPLLVPFFNGMYSANGQVIFFLVLGPLPEKREGGWEQVTGWADSK